MRVTSQIFVSALVRQVFSGGGFAAVEHQGAHDAGAVFIKCRERTGTVSLYGPAPQTSYDSGRPQDRQFVALVSSEDLGEINQRLEKELRFDPDVWVVEIEPNDDAIGALLSLTTP